MKPKGKPVSLMWLPATVLVAVVVGLALGWLLDAQARPFERSQCFGLASTVGQIADNRDRGVTLAAVEAEVERTIEAARGKPPAETYLRTEEDRKMLRDLVKLVYGTGVSKEQAVADVLKGCAPVAAPGRPWREL